MAPQASVLAVDLGGTKVAAALVGPHGDLLGEVYRAPTGPAASRAELISALDGVVRRALAGGGMAVTAVGIGSAGPVTLAAGTISPKNLPRLAGFAVREHVERLVPGARVTLRLDGTCIALAEHWMGATRGYANSMSMVVSTGVGGGLILHDALIAGGTGNAGHVGQMQIRSRKLGSARGASTLEAIASGPSAVAWARRRGWAGSTGEDLAVDCRAGNRVAQDAVRRSATAVGEAIASVSMLLDLEIVAIGGGFVLVADDYLDLVRAAIADSILFDYAQVTVVPSALNGRGPLIGAGGLVHRGDLLDATRARPREEGLDVGRRMPRPALLSPV
ncbi:ROK family protein [Cryobacterium roopkundense]|uniref:Glucokinase n=1 Tax=Cryobacterium roopkundense TaxID=1001240 RepID=A0A7W8ZUK0_9MICO|nr:ROK family protein [Cryobacterium roopkundense]MBB5640452.1 glucokinase [Cryobacterium roopkundense]